MIAFNVYGIPIPKQSFKFSNGRGYTPQRVVDWQDRVREEASLAMRGHDLLQGDLSVYLDFYLPDRRRKDLDNLAKGVLDACNGLVWQDDQQIVELHLTKSFSSKECGITVTAKTTER